MIKKIKKIRNRKDKVQNKRNKLNNLFYISAIKTLTKKVKLIVTDINSNKQKENNIQLKELINLIFSKIDKSLKKKIINKNKANRQKSYYSLILKKYLSNK